MEEKKLAFNSDEIKKAFADLGKAAFACTHTLKEVTSSVAKAQEELAKCKSVSHLSDAIAMRMNLEPLPQPKPGKEFLRGKWLRKNHWKVKYYGRPDHRFEWGAERNARRKWLGIGHLDTYEKHLRQKFYNTFY